MRIIRRQLKRGCQIWLRQLLVQPHSLLGRWMRLVGPNRGEEEKYNPTRGQHTRQPLSSEDSKILSIATGEAGSKQSHKAHFYTSLQRNKNTQGMDNLLASTL